MEWMTTASASMVFAGVWECLLAIDRRFTRFICPTTHKETTWGDRPLSISSINKYPVSRATTPGSTAVNGANRPSALSELRHFCQDLGYRQIHFCEVAEEPGNRRFSARRGGGA